MQPLSIREYANKYGITYEGVRKQVKRYEEELKDHIVIQNRTQYLDEYAQNFLNEVRQKSRLVVIESKANEQYKELTDTILQKDAIIQELQAKIISLQEKNLEMIESQAKLQLLTDKINDQEKELTATKEDLKTAQDALNNSKVELEVTKDKLDSFKPSILGFYRKK